MSGRPHRARGVVPALVLALFALGWLLDRAHGVLEPHRWCDAHQRVEHAHGSDVHGHAVAAPAERGPTLAEPAPAETAHEACCLQLARGGDPVSVTHSFAPAFAPPPDLSALAPPWGTSARGAVPLVLSAPKHSPPAI